MFSRVVVGADGSQESKDAVVLGATIAAATGAGLTLLGAFPEIPIVEPSGDRAAQVRAVERQLAALRDELAPAAHITAVGDGNVARALQLEAEDWHASLIVIGSSRDAALGHCAIGQTGRRLLSRFPSALAIARRGLHRDRFALANIAVGYDGGPESERALQFADRLAVQSKAELLIETVTRDPIPTLLHGESLPRELLDEVRQAAELGALKVSRGAAARTMAPSSVIGRVGEPGSVLRETSADADLMVIGSRRWGLLPRVLLGGVGEALVSDCGASLVIASTPADHAAALRDTPDADPGSAPMRPPAPSERLVR